MKPDLVITAVKGLGWEQLRPFAVSLDQSKFSGDRIVLGCGIDRFTTDCLTARDFTVAPFHAMCDSFRFVNQYRFPPLLSFLKTHGKKYRYVIWVDSGDQVVQTNPSRWLDEYAAPHNIIAARECWYIKDETVFNDPWMKSTVPEEHDWVRDSEVLCGGTVAGDPATMLEVMSQVHDIVNENPQAYDQAALNYVLRKPFGTHTIIPPLRDGWTATCSAFKTPSFASSIGRDESLLLDRAPVFDKERGLVLTPDGRKPFALVHQYNRDADWNRIMHEKYREW